jgi:hypothetical protein
MTTKPPDLDALLREYIGDDKPPEPEPEPEAASPEPEPEAEAASPEPEPEPASPEPEPPPSAGAAAAALLAEYLKDDEPGEPGAWTPEGEPAPAAPDDLQRMLTLYLEVDEDVAPGPDFSLPRCVEVDELLGRYALDGEDVEQDLAAALDEHLRQAEGATQLFSGSPLQWRQVTAARVRDMFELGERMKAYALAYAERDELAYTEDPEWDDETIKGVPPPNAPPIPPRARPGKGK